MSVTRIRPFWYRIDKRGFHHLFDATAAQTACGVPAAPSRLGASNQRSIPSERCSTCKAAISDG
jgi:hypothetical protein